MPGSRSRVTSRSRVRAEVMPMPETRESLIVVASRRAAAQPLVEVRQRRVAREIDLQAASPTRSRSPRHRSRCLRPRRRPPRGPDPVHRTTARIGALDNGLGAMTMTEACRTKTAQLLVRQIRHVDVEDHRGMQRRAREAHHELARHPRGGREMPTPGAGPATPPSWAGREAALRRPRRRFPNTARRRPGWRRR